MALNPSWPGPTAVTSTTAARKNLAGLIESDTAGNARAGVFPAHLNPLVTARADMNVDIAAFQAVAVQFGGPILLSNDGTIQLPSVLVSPVSGTNYYVVYVKQNESTSPGTDASNTTVAGATLSTSSFAAARALLPPGALELATVQMPSGKTATNAVGVTITPTFLYTAAEGGVVTLRNQTEQDAWSPTDGALAYRIDTKRLMQRANGVWVWATPAVWTGRRGSNVAITAATYADVLTVALPADAPPGRYSVVAFPFTWSGSATTHFRRVKWGGTTLDGDTVGLSVPAGSDFCFPGEWQVDHAGGAVNVVLGVQVNAGSPSANAECRLQVTYLGVA